MTTPIMNYQSALEDFHRERHIAALQEILSRFTGKPVNLLSYSEIASSLKMIGGSELGLMDIPVDAIVGSVGRYTDFTRDFLPRQDTDRERWARVKAAVLGSAGLPPIEVYKIGDLYFVRDGHHRVSVARDLKMTSIQAYVTEVRTLLPLTEELTPDQLILKSEYVDFLEATRFDDVIPSAELKVTEPGYYRKILEHIQVHRYYMGIDQRREISMPETVRDWYDNIYMPVVCVIREQGILRDFPGRTEADMYLWISDHRYLLEKRLGTHIRSDLAATHFTEERSPRLGRILQRFRRKVIDRLVPDQLENVEAPGAWRKTRELEHDCLFRDLLVPLSGEEEGWSALDQAIELAHCDGTYLNGLHVIPAERDPDDPSVQEVKQRFEERCRQAGVSGGLAIAQGEIAHEVLQQVVFNDLVIFHLAHPPGPQIMDRIESGLTRVIRSCARPILVTPGPAMPLNRIVLAYDGSVKSREALFLAAYFAGKWNAELVVMTVVELGRTSSRTLNQARRYLEKHEIRAAYLQKPVPAAEAILTAVRERQSNLVMMGGYGYSPVLEMVLGSTVDRVLRESTVPVLICQ